MPYVSKTSIVNGLSFMVHGKKNQPIYHIPSTKTQTGFTLIELLVAIGIIGVVFGAIISSAFAIQRQGRDAQRRADLQKIQASIEQFHSDVFGYPPSITTGNPILNPIDATKIYLSAVPAEPQNIKNYTYVATQNDGSVCDNVAATGTFCTKYCIYAYLENAPTDSAPACAGGLPVGYNYGVAQP